MIPKTWIISQSAPAGSTSSTASVESATAISVKVIHGVVREGMTSEIGIIALGAV
jgi:hypothetical protein